MPTYRVLFAGLGKMGFHMASFLSKQKNIDLYIHNRTSTIETKWKKNFSGVQYNFTNIISEEGNSDLIKDDEYLTVDPIDGTRNFINGINKVAIMLSFIKNAKCEFAIIYDPIADIFYHTFNQSIFKNHKQIKPQIYSNQIGFLGDHAKVYFKDIITSYTEKIRSRSIGYDVIEAIEGERSFLTVYGSKIWDLFPAMSFLKLLNFDTNLPDMEFDYSKLEKKIIFYANL